MIMTKMQREFISTIINEILAFLGTILKQENCSKKKIYQIKH